MTTVVSVAQGGTGSNNAAAARSSLGAAPSAAYDAANNAYAAANTASSTGGGGYAQANAAYAQANAAYNNSNTRLSTSGGSISGDLAITGNLTVQGNATTINVSNLSVNDSMILLSTNAVGDSNDIGFIGHFDRGPTATHAGLIRKATQNQFYLFDNYEVEPTNNVIDVSGNNFRVGNLRLGIVNANSYVTSAGMDITGQANAAYGQANAAYEQANSAYGAANNRVLKSGDTMTGQLNISSGGLLVTGNVGIGTSNPVTTLTIAKDANNLTDGLSFLNNNANDNTGSSVSFYTAFGAPFATNQLVSRISGFVTNPSSSKDGNIGLYTGTGGSVSERVRVNSSGNVGIGLTNPSTRLQVNGNVRIGSSATGVDDNADYNITSGGQLTINANDGSANNDSFVSLDLRSGHSTNAAVITLRASNFSPLSSFIDMNLNNSSRMRLFANGNVSIGTTTDYAPFSIISANVSTSIIAANGVFIGQDIGGYQQIQMNANNGAYIDFSNSSSVDYKGRIIYFNAENRMEFHTNSAERVYIDSSGNVGIATSNPSARLQINANRTSSTNAIALLLSDGVTGAQTNGVWKSIRSVSNGGSSISEIRFLETDGTNNNTGLAFVTAQAAGTLLERMRINNAGIITTPYQPAFLAKKVTINQAPWSELASYGSQLITSNRSSGFNLTTGRFTAPVAGVYVFHALARASDGSGDNTVPGFQLWKNGSQYENIDVWGSYAASYGGVIRPSFGFSIAMELAVNDFVALAYTSTSTNYVWFSGYLLG